MNGKFWKRLVSAVSGHRIEWRWVGRDSGNKGNMRAHAIAAKQAQMAAESDA